MEPNQRQIVEDQRSATVEILPLTTITPSLAEEVDRAIARKRLSWGLKHIFDLLFSAIGVILLCPFGLVIGLCIMLDSPGGVFFRQVRIGRYEKPFRIFKFRTMVSDGAAKGLPLTADGDQRITRIGRFLRQAKLDELPQLLNVFLGHMSLVGPRPEVPRYTAFYTPEQRNIFKIRPGITDWASIRYRNESRLLAGIADPEWVYIHQIMPEKIALNLQYLLQFSLRNDIHIIMKTAWEVMKYG